MAFDFPASPILNQVYTEGTRSWTFNGSTWVANVGYGTQGDQGVQGAQGFQGAQGNQGVTGSQGPQGFQGNNGSQGNQGFQGVAGPQGDQGSTGSQGPQGFQGNLGNQGPQGFQGNTGSQGAQGSTGSQGNQGFQGIAGPQGDQGAVGSQGPQGFQGNQGNQGFQGNQGVQGTNAFRIGVAVSDETTALTTGIDKIRFRMPRAMTLTEVRATVNTAPTGSTLIVSINEGDSPVTILSTDISIDAGEFSSTTAAVPPVISDTSLADNALISIDIDQVGATIAGAGLKVWLIGTT